MPLAIAGLISASVLLWALFWQLLLPVAAAFALLTALVCWANILTAAGRVLTDPRADGRSPVPAPPAAEETDGATHRPGATQTAPEAWDDTARPARSGHQEPAYLSYWVAQPWRDYAAIIRHTLTAVSRPGRRTVTFAAQALLGGRQAIVLAPVWLATMVGLVAGIVLGLAGLIVFTLGYGLIAESAVAGSLVIGGALRSADWMVSWWRRSWPACPHPGCYQPFRLPEYACPECGARHAWLRPGRYGVLWRVCRCGTRLPTASVLGRHRLAAWCPHCHRRLPRRIGRTPIVHVPIVGGPAAGKTTFACLALGGLRAGDGAGVRFVDDRDAEEFERGLARLRSGETLPRTLPRLPRATMLDVEWDRPGQCILYLFDPPGEHYTSADRIGWQRYLDLASGLLIVVDPLALVTVQRSLDGSERALVAQATPSVEEPSHVISRLVNALRTRPDGGRLRRVAVVVTKTDVLRRTTVGATLNGVAAAPSEQVDQQVRGWLETVGWGNAVRTVMAVADQVRFFSSGLDHDTLRLAEPVRWLVTGALPGRPQRLRPERPWRGRRRQEEIPLCYRVGRRILLGVLSVTALAWLVWSARTGWSWLLTLPLSDLVPPLLR